LIRPTVSAVVALLIAASSEAVSAVKLPVPSIGGRGTIESSLQSRRSVRAFDGTAMSQRELGQLLWAAQGITSSDSHRTAPSAGATYPLEIYVVVLNVGGLDAGIYHYRPKAHDLELVVPGNRRPETIQAARGQQWIGQSAVVFVFAATYARTSAKYGARAERYAHIETGAAAENLALEAVALNMGTCFVGAFDESEVRTLIGLGVAESPLILLPAGRPQR
jgi:SagB-type dehydrogenase family enzyme